MQDLDRSLKVLPVSKTNIITIRYRSQSPHQASTILRVLTGLYLASHRAGLTSGVYIRRKPYDLAAVQPRLRSQVRKGLNYCEIRRVEAPELLRDGLVCNRDTMQRQNRAEAEFSDRSSGGGWLRRSKRARTSKPLGRLLTARLRHTSSAAGKTDGSTSCIRCRG